MTEPTRPALTARQLEVLVMLSHGLTFEQVGRRLGLSRYTIHSHMRAALRRLDARNTVHAFRRALELELVRLDAVRVDHRTGVTGR